MHPVEASAAYFIETGEVVIFTELEYCYCLLAMMSADESVVALSDSAEVSDDSLDGDTGDLCTDCHGCRTDRNWSVRLLRNSCWKL